MLKLANQIIDIHDDVERAGIRKLASQNPNVYVMTDDERSQLSDTDFALSVITKKAHKLNKFPINSPDSTWLSNQYFEMNHHRLPKEAAATAAYHIEKACERFSVKPCPSVVGLSKEAQSNIYYERDGAVKPISMRKTASLDDMAEAQKIGDNYTFAQYAFSSPKHVEMGEKYFEKCASQMPLDTRHKYAAALQRRAKELGMSCREGMVQKYASDHYSGQVDAHIRARRNLIEVTAPEYAKAFDKLASMKKQLTPGEFAQAMHGLDKKAKLTQYYGGYLKNPFEATFAAEPDPYAGWRTKVAGTTLNADQLKNLVHAKADKIKEYFGQSVLDELKSNPSQVFDSLPNDAKEIMVNFADGTL